MTREQYLSLRLENKQRGILLKSMKRMSREDQSSCSKGVIPRSSVRVTMKEVSDLRKEFRVNHIFLCLLRGKTRQQIENNFELQYPKDGLYSWVENQLTDLADKYGLVWDSDENHKVISIEWKKTSCVV